MGYGIGAAALPFPFVGTAEAAPPAKKLVVLALRGGVDGLHLVPPVGDLVSTNFRNAYEGERPTIRFEPISANPPAERTTIDVGNDYFHLHPQLGFFADVFAGTSTPNINMRVVHAVGGTNSRSHFSSLDALEWATPHEGTVGNFNGWLNDALTRIYPAGGPPGDLSPLNGIASQVRLPKSLTFQGSSLRRATPVNDLEDVALADPSRQLLLEQLYAANGRHSAISASADNALGIVSTLANLPASPTPFATLYPNGSSGLNRHFHDIARLINDGPSNASVFTLDYNAGWDTHSNQVARLDESGAQLVQAVSDGLEQFYGELAGRAGSGGIDPDDVCTLVFTDFGRTLDENDNQGTDHGNGGVMFVLGGGLPSSSIIHTGWDFAELYPNVELTNGVAATAANLDGVGNPRTQLKALIDFRSVYRDVLTNVFGQVQADFDVIFEDATVQSAGVWS